MISSEFHPFFSIEKSIEKNEKFNCQGAQYNYIITIISSNNLLNGKKIENQTD